MSGLHDVFHVSMLRKYIADPAHILKYLEIEITTDLKHEVRPEEREDEIREKYPALL